MRDPLKDKRRDRIAHYRSEAERLLRLVQHDSMKEQIGFAVRDLEEATLSLAWPGFDDNYPLQQFADCALANAIRRLAVIDAAVRRYGPSVTLFQSAEGCRV